MTEGTVSSKQLKKLAHVYTFTGWERKGYAP